MKRFARKIHEWSTKHENREWSHQFPVKRYANYGINSLVEIRWKYEIYLEIYSMQLIDYESTITCNYSYSHNHTAL